MTLTKQQALDKIEELQEYIKQIDGDPIIDILKSMYIPDDYIFKVDSNEYIIKSPFGLEGISKLPDCHVYIENGDLKVRIP